MGKGGTRTGWPDDSLAASWPLTCARIVAQKQQHSPIKPCLKSNWDYVASREVGGLGWWGRAATEEHRTRFLLASPFGMTFL